MKKMILSLCVTGMMAAITACSNPSSSAVQTRNDLSREHLAGLSSGMKRSDVIDLIGENDEALASKEDFDIYSLADGTTAVLRYQDDVLQSAFIRDADNFEEALFNIFEKPETGGITVNDATSGETGTGNDNTDNMNNNTNGTDNTGIGNGSDGTDNANIGNGSDNVNVTDNTNETGSMNGMDNADAGNEATDDSTESTDTNR